MAVKKPTVTKLKAKLDAIFSKYIRLHHADQFGNCQCYTCGKYMHWTKIQNGHLFSRGRYSTRFDPDNCRPQCAGCNVMAKGNYQEYFPRILSEIGQEALTKLEVKSKTMVKLSTVWYTEQVDYYTKEVAALQLEKGAF